jgi:hypothetical protein
MNSIWDTPCGCVCEGTNGLCPCDPQERVVRNVAEGNMEFQPEQLTTLITELSSPPFDSYAPSKIALMYMTHLQLAQATLIVWWKFFRTSKPR